MRRHVKEQTIEEYLVERVKALGGYAPKVDVRGRRGQVDRVVLFPGGSRDPRQAFALLVELKAPGQSPRSEQLREHERLRALGFHVRVPDSFESVDEMLRPFETQ